MHVARAHLLASTYWSIRRPQKTLTPGHFMIRLNDPSIAFGTESAADFLRCYGHLRRALQDLVGATAAQLYLSRNWQPVGDAIGEPLSDSSTPTLHLFFIWPGSQSATAVLSRPAHQRMAVGDTAALDSQIAAWNGGLIRSEGGACAAASESTGSTPPSFTVDPVPADGEAAPGHWRATLVEAVASLDQLSIDALMELAGGVEQAAWNSSPRHAGIAVWATDVWRTAAEIHLFARQHGPGDEQLTEFVVGGGLDVLLGSCQAASPTVGS